MKSPKQNIDKLIEGFNYLKKNNHPSYFVELFTLYLSKLSQEAGDIFQGTSYASKTDSSAKKMISEIEKFKENVNKAFTLARKNINKSSLEISKILDLLIIHLNNAQINLNGFWEKWVIWRSSISNDTWNKYYQESWK
jgi:hypothetical protein